jgi:glucokinase
MTARSRAGPVEAARHYLESRNERPARAAFAVAGPVTGADAFELTNHPWRFSIQPTRQALDLAWLELINDFHAVALGVLDAAEPGSVRQIGGGTAVPNGNIGILGPGTGLGMASLIWDPQHGSYVAAAGEGAHSTVPVGSAREFALIEWLRRDRYSHVSVERVCSGKGLANLYLAIAGVDARDLPELLPEEITARALSGECEACREALTLMLGILGRVAGNLALTINATGGIYFAGGILPQLGASYVEGSRLRGSFTAKGRFTAYVDRIPTFLIEDPFLPLKGLRRYALSFAGG